MLYQSWYAIEKLRRLIPSIFYDELFAYLGKGSSVRYDGSIDGEFVFVPYQSNLRLTEYPLGPSSGCHPSLASARSDVRRSKVNKKIRVQSRREGRAWTCNISQGQQGYLHIGRFDMSPRLSGVSMPKPIETRDPCSTLFGGQGPLCRDEHGVDSRRCRYIPYTVYSPAMLTILSAAIRSSRRSRDSSHNRWVSASISRFPPRKRHQGFLLEGPANSTARASIVVMERELEMMACYSLLRSAHWPPAQHRRRPLPGINAARTVPGAGSLRAEEWSADVGLTCGRAREIYYRIYSD